MQINNGNKNPKDEELMALLVMDDHNAFRDLFYAYYKPIVNFLTVITGSSEAAEDISQDIFAYIWENRHKLSAVRNFRSYLFTVARNAALKYIRQDQKLSNLLDDTYSGNDGESYASDEILVAEETRLLVMIAVDRMPKLRRKVFIMSRYEGLTNDQIAKALGISNESVASHINTAKNDIKKLITAYLFFFQLLH